MALRTILQDGDAALQKKSRVVTEFNARLHELLDDMQETLVHAGGAGLAAPQVGVLRRAVLVLETNVPEDSEEYLIELINPEIIEIEGEQTGTEGCLSLPGALGIVSRPQKVKVRAQDRYGKTFEVEGEGLTARAFCHEIDHLEGILYTARAERMLSEDEIEAMYADQDHEEGE